MRFEIHGPHRLEPNDLTNTKVSTRYWNKVEETAPGLRSAYGCYVFAKMNAGNFKPWYVGKTDISFEQECSTIHKLLFLKELIEKKMVRPM